VVKPIKQTSPYKPEIGDILSGGEYLVRKIGNKEKLEDYLYVSTFGNNPWHALERLGIFAEEIRQAFRYKCPFSDNIYYHFIPVALVVKNGTQQYRDKLEKDNGPTVNYDFMFDLKWIKDMSHGVLPEANSVQMAFLGHGYTDGTLPSDGFGEFENFLIELDNGDFLFGHCWVRYNK
jgi:hypothetical protein